ncbi:MAG TPA: TadE/TadG family type IV pilus assembly protein [Dongiaceae bacterium]|nr:TadE/TadG family type IV pilus assembly protein [Dongiaceae bacterium]
MEFALVLPILLVVALAIVQVGLIARDQLLVVQAARAGAREAAVSPDPAAVRSAAAAAAPGLAGIAVQVTRAGSIGDPVTVQAAAATPVRVPFVAWLFPSQISLHAVAVDRQEFP